MVAPSSALRFCFEVVMVFSERHLGQGSSARPPTAVFRACTAASMPAHAASRASVRRWCCASETRRAASSARCVAAPGLNGLGRLLAGSVAAARLDATTADK